MKRVAVYQLFWGDSPQPVEENRNKRRLLGLIKTWPDKKGRIEVVYKYLIDGKNKKN